jgi:membrane-associated phospholipid phosphatase
VANTARDSEPAIVRAWKVICPLSFAAFAVLAVEAHRHPYFDWDLSIATRLQRLQSWCFVMQLVSAPGYGWRPFALIAAIVLILLIAGRRSWAGFLISSAGIGELLVCLAKRMVGRPRPAPGLVAVAHRLLDPSFPSGHVMFYCSACGFLLFVACLETKRSAAFKLAMAILAAIPIVLVGPSRVYLGEHWPSDVLGAYLLAGAWLPLVFAAYWRWKTRSMHAKAAQRGIAPR